MKIPNELARLKDEKSVNAIVEFIEGGVSAEELAVALSDGFQFTEDLDEIRNFVKEATEAWKSRKKVIEELKDLQEHEIEEFLAPFKTKLDARLYSIVHDYVLSAVKLKVTTERLIEYNKDNADV